MKCSINFLLAATVIIDNVQKSMCIPSELNQTLAMATCPVSQKEDKCESPCWRAHCLFNVCAFFAIRPLK